ncbi:MAG: DNA gyrase inhibitor YacG [Rhodobiaceae bacterium]|nr:DNA gyrase inhibitor YacG [Rhodobiaceae bacterium]
MTKSKCPNCKKIANKDFFPFCSQRCSQVDLNRWLGEGYQINKNLKIIDL